MKYGFEGFSKAMGQIASETIKIIVKENKDEMSTAITNLFYNLDGPTVIDRKKSVEEIHFGKIFYGFIEINNCFDNMNDILLYIRRYPYGNNASRVRYLRYNVENFFNEVYILKERLISYATKIERAFKSTEYEKVVHEVIQPLYKVISDTLKPIIDIRGHHVHVARYSDRGFDKLSSLELVIKTGDLPQFVDHFMREYKTERKRWIATLAKVTETVKYLLDVYFERLYIIVFNENEEMRYPNTKHL